MYVLLQESYLAEVACLQVCTWYDTADTKGMTALLCQQVVLQECGGSEGTCQLSTFDWLVNKQTLHSKMLMS